jgi:hypothetical protein
MIKEFEQEGVLMAYYIDCQKCGMHGTFKHVPEHGKIKAKELCIKDWNNRQQQMNRITSKEIK